MTDDDQELPLPAETQTELRELGRKWRHMVPTIGPDSIPTLAEMHEIVAWQQIESDVLKAHGDWLKHARARFDRFGLPWTTQALALYESVVDQ